MQVPVRLVVVASTSELFVSTIFRRRTIVSLFPGLFGDEPKERLVLVLALFLCVSLGRMRGMPRRNDGDIGPDHNLGIRDGIP